MNRRLSDAQVLKFVWSSTLEAFGRQLVALHAPARVEWAARFGITSAAPAAQAPVEPTPCEPGMGRVRWAPQHARRARYLGRTPEGVCAPRHRELDRRAPARRRPRGRGSRAATSPSAQSQPVTSLRDTYDLLRDLLPEVEPFAALERAEAHRAFWRPAEVRVVLLAESHVFTNATDLERCITRLPGAPAGIPVGFVRLVYCLGTARTTSSTAESRSRRTRERRSSGGSSRAVSAAHLGRWTSAPHSAPQSPATYESRTSSPCSTSFAMPACGCSTPRRRRCTARRGRSRIRGSSSRRSTSATNCMFVTPSRPRRRPRSCALAGCRGRARHARAPPRRIYHRAAPAKRALDYRGTRRRLGRIRRGRPACTVIRAPPQAASKAPLDPASYDCSATRDGW